MTAPIPLDELKPHECGLVSEVGAQDDDLERLMAMGVCAGRTVELVQHGDPMIIKVYGTRLGVSRRLANRILVQRCAARSCAIEVPLGGLET